MRFNKFWKLIASLTISLSSGCITSLFSNPAEGWYATLIKPAGLLPDWLLMLAWTVFHILVGISLYLVWARDFKVTHQLFNKKTRKAWNPWSERLWRGDWKKWNVIAIFLVQYVLGIKWAFTFFALHNLNTAFFVALMLWISVVYLVVNFYRISKPAAWLLAPYLVWVTYKLYLSAAIWCLN